MSMGGGGGGGWQQLATSLTGMGNGAGFVYGALKAANDDQINPGKFLQVRYSPNADPLLQALYYDAMLQMGVDPGILRAESGPLERVRAAAASSGQFTQDDLNRLENGLLSIRVNGSLSGAPDAKVKRAVDRALGLAGFTSFEDMMRQEFQHRATAEAEAQKLGPILAQQKAAREAAMGAAARTIQDYPGATAEDIARLEQSMYRQAQTDLEHQAGRQRDDILRAANIGGFNPGRALGELGGLVGVEASRARTTAIDRALAMLSGRQTLANQSISANLGYLQQGTSNLNTAAALRSNANISAAQLAAAQLDAMSRANVENALSNRQTRDAYVVSAANSFMDAWGGGGGGGGLGGGGGGGGLTPTQMPSYGQRNMGNGIDANFIANAFGRGPAGY